MRLAGIEKVSITLTHRTWRRPRLPGLSSHQLAHVAEFLTPAPVTVKAKSPISWASCSTAGPGAPSCFPPEQKKLLPAWTNATVPSGSAAP
jgi:hypothetical protein